MMLTLSQMSSGRTYDTITLRILLSSHDTWYPIPPLLPTPLLLLLVLVLGLPVLVAVLLLGPVLGPMPGLGLGTVPGPVPLPVGGPPMPELGPLEGGDDS